VDVNLLLSEVTPCVVRSSHGIDLPVTDHRFDLGHCPDKILHRWSVREPHVANAFALSKVPNTTRINVEKYTRNNDNLVFHAFFQKYQTIIERLRKLRQVRPNVKGRSRDPLDSNTENGQFFQHKISLLAKMALQGPRIAPNEVELHQGQGETLQRRIGTAVQIASSRTQHVDNLLGSNDPAHAETGTAPVLGQSIDNENGVSIDILNVGGTADCLGPVGLVVVSAVLGIL
jgi:hypothetical protein